MDKENSEDTETVTNDVEIEETRVDGEIPIDKKLRTFRNDFNYFFKCTNCLCKIIDKSTFEDHFIICKTTPVVHPPITHMIVYECEFCTFQYKSELGICNHLRSHEKTKELNKYCIYNCPECGRQYTQEKDKCHTIKPLIFYKCPECTTIKISLGKFLTHLQIHDLYLKKYCLICYAIITKENHHCLEPQSFKIYACGKCCYHTKRQQILFEHLQNAHATKIRKLNINQKKNKKYELCPKCFTYQSPLKAHLKIKHYSCNECSFQTTKRSRFMYHQSSHVLKKHYTCEICFDIFSAAYKLQKHMKLHNAGKKLYRTKNNSDSSKRNSTRSDSNVVVVVETDIIDITNSNTNEQDLIIDLSD